MFGDYASSETFKRVAVTAENLEMDAVWAGEHIALTSAVSNTYPFSESGETPTC